VCISPLSVAQVRLKSLVFADRSATDKTGKLRAFQRPGRGKCIFQIGQNCNCGRKSFYPSFLQKPARHEDRTSCATKRHLPRSVYSKTGLVRPVDLQNFTALRRLDYNGQNASHMQCSLEVLTDSLKFQLENII